MATEDIDRKAKAYLKEIMDNYDSADDELPAIWDAWFDRIATLTITPSIWIR